MALPPSFGRPRDPEITIAFSERQQTTGFQGDLAKAAVAVLEKSLTPGGLRRINSANERTGLSIVDQAARVTNIPGDQSASRNFNRGADS